VKKKKYILVVESMSKRKILPCTEKYKTDIYEFNIMMNTKSVYVPPSQIFEITKTDKYLNGENNRSLLSSDASFQDLQRIRIPFAVVGFITIEHAKIFYLQWKRNVLKLKLFNYEIYNNANTYYYKNFSAYDTSSELKKIEAQLNKMVKISPYFLI